MTALRQGRLGPLAAWLDTMTAILAEVLEQR
jgi:hypothetical protein